MVTHSPQILSDEEKATTTTPVPTAVTDTLGRWLPQWLSGVCMEWLFLRCHKIDMCTTILGMGVSENGWCSSILGLWTSERSWAAALRLAEPSFLLAVRTTLCMPGTPTQVSGIKLVAYTHSSVQTSLRETIKKGRVRQSPHRKLKHNIRTLGSWWLISEEKSTERWGKWWKCKLAWHCSKMSFILFPPPLQFISGLP